MSSEELSAKQVYGLLVLAIVVIIIAAIMKYVDTLISQLALSAAVILIGYVSYLLFGSPKGPRRKAKAKAAPKPEKKELKAEPSKAVKEKPDLHAEEHVPKVVIPRAHLADLPIETIEGIGQVHGKELRSAGIRTVQNLVESDPQRVSEICDVSEALAKRWIGMANLTRLDSVSEEDAEAIVFSANITTVKMLAKANAVELHGEIEAAVKAGNVRVPTGYKFTLKKVQAWIDEAKQISK